MPSGTQYTAEPAEITETPESKMPDAEPKAKSASGKVTLVKPVQLDDSSTEPSGMSVQSAEAAAPAKKSAARPKVGRASTSRKKKTDTKGEKKPRKKADSATAAETQVPSEDNSSYSDPATAAPSSVQTPVVENAPERLNVEQLQHELAKVDLAEWTPDQAHPQSFKTILFAVALFVAINLGILMMFSASHKAKLAPPSAATATIVPASETPPQAEEPPAPAVATAPAPAAVIPAPLAVQQPPAQVTPPAHMAAPVVPEPSVKRTDVSSQPAAPSVPVEVTTLPPALPSLKTEASLPVIPAAAEAPALKAETQTPAPAEAPAAVKPAAETAIVSAPATGKTASSQELLSILDKN